MNGLDNWIIDTPCQNQEDIPLCDTCNSQLRGDDYNECLVCDDGHTKECAYVDNEENACNCGKEEE